MAQLQSEAAQFRGGRLSFFQKEWRALTSDPEILQLIKGVELEFNNTTELPFRAYHSQPALTNSETAIIDKEICKLEAIEVVSRCEPEYDQFLSPVFTVPKRDGSHRMILNLKELNKDITYYHFKMETLQAALKLITADCYMASVDLKNAYYSLPVADQHKKFLRFLWKGQLWQYNCMPNGLALAPRKFTKLLKPVFGKLREEGYMSASFLDDSLLVSESEQECMMNVHATVQLFRSLGFTVHPEKSVLQPAQSVQYLGVIIDSRSMTVRLTDERKDNLKKCCKQVLRTKKLTVRDLAKVIGKIVASFPAVKFGQLYYRHLEEAKKAALRKAKGCYDSPALLSPSAKAELHWWLENVSTAQNDIALSDPEITIASDASLSGWGCVCESERSGGLWLPAEATFHINYLELKAAFFALKCFESKITQKHVRLLLDNTTAIACIENFGTSHSESCNELTFCIWQWCQARQIWLSVAHIPGKDNTAADQESRKLNLDTEWQLHTVELKSALAQLQVSPSIDLFASRLNKQFPCYVSWRADPEAHAVNAFSLSWSNLIFYAFPPFSLILQVLQKVKRDRSMGVIIVPAWPTQLWWPVLHRMLTKEPIQLPSTTTLLTLPSHPEMQHRLLPGLKLLACRISGRDI